MNYKISNLKEIFSNIVYRMSGLDSIYKLNKYFYINSDKKIIKYKKYCIYQTVDDIHHLIIKI